MRVAILAAARFPICEPFAGGLEAHTWQLATGLRARGHSVTVFAGEGSDPALGVRTFAGQRPVLSPTARADLATTPAERMYDHHAYLSTMLELASDAGRSFDVVHNNSVHHMPLAMASAVPVAQVTTLHCPPTAWMELALQASPSPPPIRFCAVSDYTAASWRRAVPHVLEHVDVVSNAVDLDVWQPGPGGSSAVWSGRIVREKGLELAIDASRRAGLDLDIAGPIMDDQYWREEIRPRLGSGITWVGHLARRELRHLVGASCVAVVSPRWDEPFGLVALEALACGTPVAALARGGLVDLLDDTCARTVAGEDTALLAAAILDAATLDRRAVRHRAEAVGSIDRMISEYEAVYRRAQAER